MRLEAYMLKHNLGDEAMADLLGIDRSTVNRLRRSEAKPSWPLAAKIRAATNGKVTADDFLPETAA